MKLLLDENLPHELRHHLVGYEVFTTAYLRWAGIRNGRLLSLAAGEGFDALITLDAGFEHQQNAATLPTAVILLRAPSNKIDALLPLVPKLLGVLADLSPQTLIRVT